MRKCLATSFRKKKKKKQELGMRVHGDRHFRESCVTCPSHVAANSDEILVSKNLPDDTCLDVRKDDVSRLRSMLHVSAEDIKYCFWARQESRK